MDVQWKMLICRRRDCIEVIVCIYERWMWSGRCGVAVNIVVHLVEVDVEW